MASLLLCLVLPTLTTATILTAAPKLSPRSPFPNRLLPRENGAGTSCLPWDDLESSCAAATPSFTLLSAFASQAPCLCYSSSTWAPDVYDSAFVTCLSYLSTASPAFYSSISGASLPRTPCLAAASIVGPGASPAATSGNPYYTTDLYYSACFSWQSISSTCDASTPGFATLPVSAEDNCLCYTSGTYAPSIFDGYWESCLTYYSTASPEIYSSSLGGDAGVKSPCALFVPTASTAAAVSTGTGAASPAHSTASSGAVVTTTSGAASTSIPLTTTAAATTSATGSGTGSSFHGVPVAGLLVVGVLAFMLVL